MDSVFKVMYLIGENPFSLVNIIPVDKKTEIQDPVSCLRTGLVKQVLISVMRVCDVSFHHCH